MDKNAKDKNSKAYKDAKKKYDDAVKAVTKLDADNKTATEKKAQFLAAKKKEDSADKQKAEQEAVNKAAADKEAYEAKEKAQKAKKAAYEKSEKEWTKLKEMKAGAKSNADWQKYDNLLKAK